MENILTHQVVHWNLKERASIPREMILEEPLSIRIQGEPYSVVLRTPGDEMAQVAGFCLAEGLVDSKGDLGGIGYCDDSGTNVITVTLKKSRLDQVSRYLDRRGFISQTSCGLCGKELVDELFQSIKPLSDTTRFDIQKAYDCLNNLHLYQPIRKRTRATHGALIYDRHYEVLSSAEDVGRHNALDKAIGKLFLDGRLDKASLLVLSSRISYEMVQKAARARIPVIVAASRPTVLALETARKLNLTLASQAKGEGLYIFCGEERLSGDVA